MARPRGLPNNENGSYNLKEILKTVTYFAVLQGPLLLPCIIASFQAFFNSKAIQEADQKLAELKKIEKQQLHEEKKRKKKYEKIIENLKKQHEEELISLKAQHLQELQLNRDKKLKNYQTNYTIRIKKLLEEESEKEQSHLAFLTTVQPAILSVLDLHCSPYKPRKKRILSEQEIMQNAPVEFHEGLQSIFQYDHKHCGGGLYGNGQIWRIWFQLWKAQAQTQKYKNIVERLQMEDNDNTSPNTNKL